MVHPRLLKALKFKVPGDDKIDRLSALPDDILRHIMSYLPTEIAAATSVLSTRWKDLFISLPDIDLTVCKCWYALTEEAREREVSNFLTFGFRLILLRNKVPLRKFQLFVSPFVENLRVAIDSLLSAALLAKVQELDICVEGDQENRLYLPRIFTSKSLVTLTIETGEDLIAPSRVCLPNLKVLRFNSLKSIDEVSFVQLIQGCPSLEELSLKWRCLENVDRTLNVSAPFLKKLVLSCMQGRYSLAVESNNLVYLDCNVYGELKFAINAPCLEYFKYQGYPVEVKFVQDLRTIVDATIAFDEFELKETENILMLQGENAFELINGLQCVKSLNIESHSLKTLYDAGRFLPDLVNLTSLALDLYCDSESTMWWNMIPSLLESAPNLEALNIVSCVSDNQLTCEEELGILLQKAFPSCYIRQLKEIKIKVSGNDQEFGFKLVKRFLKNGKSLKKITLYGSLKHWESSPKDYNKILSFTKSSKDCRIVFDHWMNGNE
nr:F-box protein At4g22280-like [Coffea arabica]